MTAPVRISERPSRVIRQAPGWVERAIFSVVMFVLLFGTPADWFTENTGSASGPASNPLLVATMVVGAAVLSLGLIGNGEAVRRTLTLEPLLPLLVLWIGFSFLWSPAPFVSIAEIVKFGSLAIIALSVMIRFRFREILGILAIVVSIGLLLDLAFVVAMGSLGRSSAGWDGLSTQKNGLGTHAVQSLPILLIGTRTFAHRRFTLYSMTAVAVVLLVGSQSKTSLAAGALTALSAVVFVAFRARKTLYGAVVIALGTTSIAALAFATANISLLAGYLEKDATLTGRTEMWPIVFGHAETRLLTGYGYGGYWNGFFSAAHDVWIYAAWRPTHAHNAGLQVLVELGVVGLLLYGAITVRGLMNATLRIRFVPGPLALFPLVWLTLVLMASITESGPMEQRFGLIMFMLVTMTAATGLEAFDGNTPHPGRGTARTRTPSSTTPQRPNRAPAHTGDSPRD